MTWPELLEHMDNLEDWGQDELKNWRSQSSKLLQEHKVATDEASCVTEDMAARTAVQNRLFKAAGACEAMCKEVGAYPNCPQCKDFVKPDETPGVMTWDELLPHMDNLVAWGQEELKTWAANLRSCKMSPGSWSATAMILI